MSVEELYKELYIELEFLEKSGIVIKISGKKLPAKEVIKVHLLKEKGSYMKDYVTDTEGKLLELHFHKLKL